MIQRNSCIEHFVEKNQKGFIYNDTEPVFDNLVWGSVKMHVTLQGSSLTPFGLFKAVVYSGKRQKPSKVGKKLQQKQRNEVLSQMKLLASRVFFPWGQPCSPMLLR